MLVIILHSMLNSNQVLGILIHNVGKCYFLVIKSQFVKTNLTYGFGQNFKQFEYISPTLLLVQYGFDHIPWLEISNIVRIARIRGWKYRKR